MKIASYYLDCFFKYSIHYVFNLFSVNWQPSRPGSAVSVLQKANEISTELRQRRTSRTSITFQPLDDTASRKLSAFGSRRSVGERSFAYSDDTDSGSGTDYNDDDVCIVKKDFGFRKVNGQPGMYYKVSSLPCIPPKRLGALGLNSFLSTLLTVDVIHLFCYLCFLTSVESKLPQLLTLL